jgi:hypothetical protein
VFFAQAQRFAATPDGEAGGMTPVRDWAEKTERGTELFRELLLGALRLPEATEAIGSVGSQQASTVLPTAELNAKKSQGIFATVIAWAALDVLGRIQTKTTAEAAVRSFDVLRLREPLAEAFAGCGIAGEERWKAVARVRAVFAHAAWLPSIGEPLPPGAPVLSWEHDSEIGWLIGTHEYEGIRYFVKEPFEQLVWWSALPALMEIAKTKKVDRELLDEISTRVNRRLEVAEKGGYRAEALIDAARQSLKAATPERDNPKPKSPKPKSPKPSKNRS